MEKAYVGSRWSLATCLQRWPQSMRLLCQWATWSAEEVTFFMFSETMIVSRQAYWLPTVVMTQNSFYKVFGSFDGVYVSIPGSMSLVVAFKVSSISGAKREYTGPRSYWAKCHIGKPSAQSQYCRFSTMTDIIMGILRERGWLRKGLQDARWFGWSSDCFLFGEAAGLQLNADFQRIMFSRVKWGKAWSLNGPECRLQSQRALLQILVSHLLTPVIACKWMKLWISAFSTVKWDNKSAQLITGWMRQYMWSAKDRACQGVSTQ